MRKIKKSAIQKHDHESTNKNYMLAGIAAAVVLILIVLIVIENTGEKITVKNNTDLKLEYVQAYFVGGEGALNDQIEFTNIETGKSSTIPMEQIDLSGEEANLEIYFKFENQDELFVDSGYFNDVFKGKVAITFTQSDEDTIVMHVKASNGLLPSKQISCNEDFNIYLEEGYVD